MVEPEVLSILKESLDQQKARIAVVDSDSTIVLVNEAWCTYCKSIGAAAPFGLGSNYLKALESHWGDGPANSGESGYIFAAIHQGLLEVLAGKQPLYEREHTCALPGVPESKLERFRILIRPVHLVGFSGAQLRYERAPGP